MEKPTHNAFKYLKRNFGQEQTSRLFFLNLKQNAPLWYELKINNLLPARVAFMID
jgi:hypothetical protein